MVRKDFSNSNSQVDIAVMNEKIRNIETGVNEMNGKLDRNYVTKDELALTKEKLDRLEKIIYGVVMAVVLAVVGAVMSLVLRK